MRHQQQIEQLKIIMLGLSADTLFVHHQWYGEQHLQLVETLSLEYAARLRVEFPSKYPKADEDILLTLIWIHDYEKIIRHTRPDTVEDDEWDIHVLDQLAGIMQNLGLDGVFIDKVLVYYLAFEGKNILELDGNQVPIELRIVSTADAASHFTDFFFETYRAENPDIDAVTMARRNRSKLEKDWQRKFALAEIKAEYADTYEALLERYGTEPEAEDTELRNH